MPSTLPRCSSFFCSGRALVLERLDHLRDQADLRVHARAGDEALAAPVGDQRAHEGRVPAVAQRDLLVEHDRRVLLDGHRFAGERGLLDLQVEALEQAHVRGNVVAGFEQDDVAADDLAAAGP